jgi:multidrug resistance efflux pump
VRKGDTIAFISETKSDYFDPQLVERTLSQVKAKEATVRSYQEKVTALDGQVSALLEMVRLKMQQTQNKVEQGKLKVTADSIDLKAAAANYQIAKAQLEREQEMYKKGIKSLTNLETKEQKLQETQSKQIAQESKLLVSRNELENAHIELNAVTQDYNDKLAKAKSDRFSALSNVYDAEGSISKLQNQYTNYLLRANLYYILAPQDCYISKLYKTGVGEIVKEGDEIVEVTPTAADLAVDMYVEPSDLPLIQTGHQVRFIFDGWPAIVLSGWQKMNVGTFNGKVIGIDQRISDNGKFRILVAPDPNKTPWPAALRIGSGAQGIALLNDVPVWYELWRKLNSFPPDFYEEESKKEEKVKFKAPIKRVK